jgi:hypothetical protein
MIIDFNKNASHKFASEDFTSYMNNIVDSGVSYGILSDGCSSSEGDVILGSRFYHRFIKLTFDLIKNDGPDKVRQCAVETALLYASLAFKTWAMDNKNLFKEDALFTSLNFLVNKSQNFIHLIMYGDGFLYVEDFDGNKNIVRFDYDNNMPLYIGYDNKDVEQITMRQNGVCDICISDEIVKEVYYGALFKYTDVKKLFIFSDGISQIEGMDENDFIQQICEEDSPDAYLDPRFLKRKANFLLRNKKLNDDVSFVGYTNIDES